MKILVFDDKQEQRYAALQQLKGHEVHVVSSYRDAQLDLAGDGDRIKPKQFDIVLTDLLVPAPRSMLSDEACEQYAGQEMPLGAIIVLLALKMGVKKIGLVTDANHHDHPASAALDILLGGFSVGDVEIVCTNRAMLSGEFKDWALVLEQLGVKVDFKRENPEIG